MMKVAIIGSGISGLTSAYLLAEKAHVTLYESHNELGGHANTHTAIFDGKHVPVDTGFMIYNPDMYPNFTKLLQRLGVESVQTKMNYSVLIPNKIVYKSSFPFGFFNKRETVSHLKYIKFLFEIKRFKKIVRKGFTAKEYTTETLDQFMQKHNFSSELFDWFVIPLLSAIWSCSDRKVIGELPAHAVFTFLSNHKVLSKKRAAWCTIRGGSVEYVSKLQSFLLEKNVLIRTKDAVTSVSRTEHSVTVISESGTEQYDYVIFATHADTTLDILSDKTADENSALSLFTYSKNTTVLHSETKVLPKHKSLWAAWNYTVHKDISGNEKIMFTYNMNSLHKIDYTYPVFVTLNSPIEIQKSKIHGIFSYTHPQYTTDSLKGQAIIKEIQGRNRTFFTGAHLGHGFHEDGVVSAINALKVIHVLPPWDIVNKK